MAGGGSDSQQQQPSGLATAADAQASGTAGTAGPATSTAAMPQWQKGLMGALTGNAAFGRNAPAIHQLMTQGLMGSQPQQQAPPMAQPGQPPMQAPPPGIGQPPMQAPLPGVGQRPMQGMPPQAQQNPMMAGLQNPWMRMGQ